MVIPEIVAASETAPLCPLLLRARQRRLLEACVAWHARAASRAAAQLWTN